METRDIKELLMLMRNNIHRIDTRDCWGLCELAARLKESRRITGNEYDLLRLYIAKNKPIHARCAWWYDLGDAAPRLKWLDEQIAKL